jgi:hypothetical protein
VARVTDIIGGRLDTVIPTAERRSARGEVAVITARVVHRDAQRAAREAARLGGVFDPISCVWQFRATSAFELQGGVQELRFSGLLPLEMRYRDQLAAVWVDFDFGRRVMQWRPIGARTEA